MMTSCVGMRKAKKAEPTHAPPGGVPSSDRRGTTNSDDQRDAAGSFSASSSTDGTENMTSGKQSSSSSNNNGWLARVCDKFRGNRPRLDRCEKCGEKSDTCRAKASFVTGRKVFMCEGCRLSSDKMKSMYEQLWRSLSVRDPPRLVGRRISGGDLASSAGPPSSSASSSRSRGVVRARSMRTPRPPVAAPDSGYDTATSLDSSCSNGRLSPEPVTVTAPGECHRGPCGPPPHPESCPQRCHEFNPLQASSSSVRNNNPAVTSNKDKAEVFRGGDFRSEHAQLREIQAGPHTRVYTRPPPPYRPRQTPPPPPPHAANTTNYDGFLEIRTPNSPRVKYVFRPREDREPGVVESVDDVHQSDDDDLAGRREEKQQKRCYRCSQFRRIAFRAPFGNGWLCEDCSDDLM